MKQEKYLLLLAWVLITFFSSCSSPGTHHSFVLTGLALQAEGPLYEGANTLQARVQPALEAWLQQQGKTTKDIRSVKLVKARVHNSDTTAAALLKSLVMQVSAPSLDMAQAAVLNPLPVGATQWTLGISDKTDWKDFLARTEIFLILDAELGADREETLVLQTDLEFDVELKN